MQGQRKVLGRKKTKNKHRHSEEQELQGKTGKVGQRWMHGESLRQEGRKEGRRGRQGMKEHGCEGKNRARIKRSDDEKSRQTRRA